MDYFLILLEQYEEGLNTLDQVLMVATEDEPKDFEFLVDIETRMAKVMRLQNREAEAVEIERRLKSVTEAMEEEKED